MESKWFICQKYDILVNKTDKNADKIIEYYNSTDLYIHAAAVEVECMTAIEAMACGCCVITTANGMCPEIIKNGINGFISNDESELKSFLNNCLEDPSLCKRMGEEARKTIIENFSLESFTNRWNEVLQKAITKNWWEL